MDEQRKAVRESATREACKKWSGRFGGGMVAFDNAYADAMRDGQTTAEAQRGAVAVALLDFAPFLLDAYESALSHESLTPGEARNRVEDATRQWVEAEKEANDG